MKLLKTPTTLALIALLSLSTACNTARFTGKNGPAGDQSTNSSPIESPTPGSTTPGSTTPGTKNPEMPSPGTPSGTPGTPSVTPGNPTPGVPGTTPQVPGTTPGTPGNPGTTPTVPGTTTGNPDPDCLAKGSCQVPCDPSLMHCPVVPSADCKNFGIDCPNQDNPNQSDDPSQDNPGQN